MSKLEEMKTICENGDLTHDMVYELAKQIDELQIEIRENTRIFKGIAYSTFKGDSFEKMAREYAKEILNK